MKIVLDEMRCDGHGTCVDACPEVFELGPQDDVVRVLDTSPPAELRDKVLQAARVCPKAAILVEEA